jgi:putative tricarboxylic transport membrane protein
MLPTLVVALTMAFGLILVAQASRSPTLAEVDWTDLPHAVRVIVVAAAAVTLYVPLGFGLTVPLLLFTLIFLVERRPLLPSLAFSIGATAAVYALFTLVLRTPLPRGLLGP